MPITYPPATFSTASLTLTGNTVIAGNVMFSSTFASNGVIAPSTLTANVNDYNPAGLSSASVMQLSANSAVTITGLTGGFNGREMYIQNIGTNAITFGNQNAGSVANNQFLFSDFTTDKIVWPGRSIYLQYDGSVNRWRDFTFATIKASNTDVLVGSDDDKFLTSKALAATIKPVSLVDQATIAWNLQQAPVAKVVLGGNRILGVPTNPTEGATYRLAVQQPNTGGPYTVNCSSNACFDFGSAGQPTWSNVANKVDFLYLDCYDAVTPFFRVTFSKG